MKITKNNIGFFLGAITIVIHLLTQFVGGYFIYKWYHLLVFKPIRILYDNTLGLVNFPMIYLFLFIIFALLISFVYQRIIDYQWDGLRSSFKNGVFSFLNFVGALFFLFYFLWAFNYYRPSLNATLELPEIDESSIDLEGEFAKISQMAAYERAFLTKDTAALVMAINWQNLEDSIRKNQESLLHSWNQDVAGEVRIRALYPKGSLLSISTAGVYIPFVCEGHVDAGLHFIQWPFTLAHEMAHGYGFTDEGVCNFIGFITCMKSQDHFIRYSGLVGYWRYLYSELKYKNPEITLDSIQLDHGMKADLLAIRKNSNSYGEYFPFLRDIMYDFYLKLHGMPAGLDSYNELIIQVQRWNQSKHAFPLSNQ